MQVKFTGITLDVKTGKDQTKRIFDDVCGHFGPAESVAVMGGARVERQASRRSWRLCVSDRKTPRRRRAVASK